MDGNYLRAAASRCLAAARECFELQAKQAFREIAEDFTRKADELDGFCASPRERAPEPTTATLRTPPP